jgi:TPR repeat protein
MKYIRLYFGSMALVVFSSVSYGGVVEEAYDIIRGGDPEKGYSMLLPHAEDGNPQAQYGLAILYKEGWGTDKDVHKAIDYYQKAAKLGHLRAMFDLGMFYQTGQLVTQDYTKAVKWYEQAAKRGYSAAMYGLGGLYFNGLGVEKDKEVGRSWYMQSAEAGFVPAINFVNEAYGLNMPLPN